MEEREGGKKKKKGSNLSALSLSNGGAPSSPEFSEFWNLEQRSLAFFHLVAPERSENLFRVERFYDECKDGKMAKEKEKDRIRTIS